MGGSRHNTGDPHTVRGQVPYLDSPMYLRYVTAAAEQVAVSLVKIFRYCITCDETILSRTIRLKTGIDSLCLVCQRIARLRAGLC